jgi:alkylresorcinol/alkylpyrone synthase
MQIVQHHARARARNLSIVEPHWAVPVRIKAVATAVPGSAITQEEIAAVSGLVFDGHRSEIERLLPVFAHAGIDSRNFCMPIEWYMKPHSWAERNRLFVEQAVDLLVAVAREAIETAGCDIADIDALVAVSTTGVATPSLDALVMERLGMRPDIRRLPLFGLGCVGGVVGLSRAADLTRMSSRGKTLMLTVELCSLTFRSNDQTKGNIIAAALFGDGAAALLLENDGDGPELLGGGSHTWPHSLDVMGWRVEDDGFGVLFSRDIPTLIRREFRQPLLDFLRSQAVGLEDLAGFVVHPGGAKVLDAFEESIGLTPQSLHPAREILRRYGNMSAATVLFVLQKMLGQGMRGLYLISALGPGFTAGFQIVNVL